jgi:hypothetical protein
LPGMGRRHAPVCLASRGTRLSPRAKVVGSQVRGVITRQGLPGLTGPPVERRHERRSPARSAQFVLP